MLVTTEQQVRIASRLYDMRDSLRRLLGAKYADVIGNYQRILARVVEQTGLDTLAAATWLAKRVDPSDGMEIMKIMVAAVETTEPSPVSET